MALCGLCTCTCSALLLSISVNDGQGRLIYGRPWHCWHAVAMASWYWTSSIHGDCLGQARCGIGLDIKRLGRWLSGTSRLSVLHSCYCIQLTGKHWQYLCSCTQVLNCRPTSGIESGRRHMQVLQQDRTHIDHKSSVLRLCIGSPQTCSLGWAG